ncbi:fimbria/pilus periplasmic chaperone, partial [Klebsiella quasipneumoniae]|nr:fimbria/pilus periplasmic chaperone [Klebsiella quasipneumoniae]
MSKLAASPRFFIITPPLFVLNPANENLLRIMYIGAPLAKDRETL